MIGHSGAVGALQRQRVDIRTTDAAYLHLNSSVVAALAGVGHIGNDGIGIRWGRAYGDGYALCAYPAVAGAAGAGVYVKVGNRNPEKVKRSHTVQRTTTIYRSGARPGQPAADERHGIVGVPGEIIDGGALYRKPIDAVVAALPFKYAAGKILVVIGIDSNGIAGAEEVLGNACGVGISQGGGESIQAMHPDAYSYLIAAVIAIDTVG